MTLDELARWAPVGTVTTGYRIPGSLYVPAARALRRAGFRVGGPVPYDGEDARDDDVVIRVFRHYGTKSPDGDIQTGHRRETTTALAKAGITDPIEGYHSITISGGTPGHRWLDVTVAGTPIGLRVLAATESEAEKELENVRTLVLPGVVQSNSVAYIKPSHWPVENLFGG